MSVQVAGLSPGETTITADAATIHRSMPVKVQPENLFPNDIDWTDGKNTVKSTPDGLALNFTFQTTGGTQTIKEFPIKAGFYRLSDGTGAWSHQRKLRFDDGTELHALRLPENNGQTVLFPDDATARIQVWVGIDLGSVTANPIIKRVGDA